MQREMSSDFVHQANFSCWRPYVTNVSTGKSNDRITGSSRKSNLMVFLKFRCDVFDDVANFVFRLFVNNNGLKPSPDRGIFLQLVEFAKRCGADTPQLPAA